MAFSFQPKTVTDGLVLHLDAANVKSYPGSGTTWTDLSPSSTTSSFVNGPTFTSDKNGGIIFDGTNDYSRFYVPNLGSTVTVQMWIKTETYRHSCMFFGWLYYDILLSSLNHFGYNTGGGDIYGISSSSLASLNLYNKWTHFSFEMRSDVSYSNNKIYINTTSRALSQQQNTEVPANRNFNSGSGILAMWGGLSDSFYMPMTCSIFSVYNRALTQAEINQNYNALKGRFGLT